MYVLQQLNRFVIPRTELTYPGHVLKMYQNATGVTGYDIPQVMKRA